MSSDDSSSETSHGARGYKQIALGCSALLLLLTGGILILLFELPREGHLMSERGICQNNLKQIGIVMHLYKTEHDGKWPQTFAELYPEYISDLGVLICPSSNVTQGNLEDVASWASYEYTPYHGESAPATVVICREKESFHEPSGKNELFADGHVAFKPDAEAVPK